MTQNKPLSALVVLASYLPVVLVQAATLFPDRVTLFQLFPTLLAFFRTLGKADSQMASAVSCTSCR